jgi:hypothetical protein
MTARGCCRKRDQSKNDLARLLTNRVSPQVLQEDFVPHYGIAQPRRAGRGKMVRVTTTAVLAAEIEARFVLVVATPKSKPSSTIKLAEAGLTTIPIRQLIPKALEIYAVQLYTNSWCIGLGGWWWERSFRGLMFILARATTKTNRC